MTLCIVWRTADDIRFASDSRGRVGAVYVDAVIKVLRIPYQISGAAPSGETPPIVARGEIGMAAAGATLIAMATKEALVEIVRSMQGIEGHNSFGMDEIASFMFRGFQEICARYSRFGSNSDTTVVVAGFCEASQRLRAFRMAHDGSLSLQNCNEVLTGEGEIEYLGSGVGITANSLHSKPFTDFNILKSLQLVIDDPTVPGVGGNIQYGAFRGHDFVVYGVATLTNGGVHYWRGPLDLNGPAFDQPGSLLPNFPLLDMIELPNE